LVPRPRLSPPGQRSLEHCSNDVERNAGYQARPGLHDPLTKAKAIDAGTEGPVGHRLKRGGMIEEVSAIGK